MPTIRITADNFIGHPTEASLRDVLVRTENMIWVQAYHVEAKTDVWDEHYRFWINNNIDEPITLYVRMDRVDAVYSLLES